MINISWDHSEDHEFFQHLLSTNEFPLASWLNLFDFDDPSMKRAAFNRIRNEVHRGLLSQHGNTCHLQLVDKCADAGEHVDHIIPISTNVLNKLRGLRPEPGKKVLTQSLGSNHTDNLVLACAACNNHKKHRIMDRSTTLRLLEISSGRELTT